MLNIDSSLTYSWYRNGKNGKKYIHIKSSYLTCALTSRSSFSFKALFSASIFCLCSKASWVKRIQFKIKNRWWHILQSNMHKIFAKPFSSILQGLSSPLPACPLEPLLQLFCKYLLPAQNSWQTLLKAQKIPGFLAIQKKLLTDITSLASDHSKLWRRVAVLSIDIIHSALEIKHAIFLL